MHMLYFEVTSENLSPEPLVPCWMVLNSPFLIYSCAVLYGFDVFTYVTILKHFDPWILTVCKRVDIKTTYTEPQHIFCALVNYDPLRSCYGIEVS